MRRLFIFCLGVCLTVLQLSAYRSGAMYDGIQYKITDKILTPDIINSKTKLAEVEFGALLTAQEMCEKTKEKKANRKRFTVLSENNFPTCFGGSLPECKYVKAPEFVTSCSGKKIYSGGAGLLRKSSRYLLYGIAWDLSLDKPYYSEHKLLTDPNGITGDEMCKIVNEKTGKLKDEGIFYVTSIPDPTDPFALSDFTTICGTRNFRDESGETIDNECALVDDDASDIEIEKCF